MNKLRSTSKLAVVTAAVALPLGLAASAGATGYPGDLTGETGGAAACTNYSPADPGTTGTGGSSVATTSPATACTVVTETVDGGLLTLTAPPTVNASPDITLSTAGDQSNTYSIAETTGDNTGSGDGWAEAISQSVFTDATTSKTIGVDGTPATGFATGVAVTARTVADISGSTDTDPTGTQPTLPLSVPTTTPGAVFQTAAVDSGLGNFTVTPTVTVDVPANTYAGVYTATTEVDLTQGP